MSDFRTEADGLGQVDVPADKLWGAQTVVLQPKYLFEIKHPNYLN